jgi:hypothetical protein
MNDPANENRRDGTGVKWRLKLSADQIEAVLDGPVGFELADADGSMLASVSIPTETINELLSPHFSISAQLQLDGSVSLDSEFFALSPPPTSTDILHLVRQALAPEMLRDEPNLQDQLQELRRKLTEALSLVDQTLADLDKSVS